MAGTPHGHWWTIAPDLFGRVRAKPPADQPWSTIIEEPEGGPGPRGATCIAGALGGPARGTLVLIVHGLGGDADRPYMLEATQAMRARGLSTLRISMRGAGRSSPDFYHAGLASDLVALLADPSLAAYERVLVLGFSLGGHVAAHLALRDDRDPRIAAIVAVCSPLDLGPNARILDGPGGWIYRRHVLGQLNQLHGRVRGHSSRYRKIQDWDRATVVPRYGFDSLEHYYESQSIGPRLREASVPLMWIATHGDPMVPAQTLEPHLRRAGAAVDVRWVRRGGHVGFPPKTDLGLPGELGLYQQILTWSEGL